VRRAQPRRPLTGPTGEARPEPEGGHAPPGRSADPPVTSQPPTDWHAWHRAYDDPGSVLSRRLAIVRDLVADALTEAPDGELRLASLCAGDGRDVLGALERHERAPDVRGVLVELDDVLSATARERAGRSGLSLRCVTGDAGLASHYVDGQPWQLVLVCGVFGNVPDEDVHRTISALASLLGVGGSVVWTRHRRPPDLTPTIRAWFAEAGFDEAAFVEVPGSSSTVGRHRLSRRADADVPHRLFRFVGDGTAAHL